MTNLPAPYVHWQDSARKLLEPLAALMQEGQADIPISGPASDHDIQADRLESFARPLLLAAHWLQSVERPEDLEFRAKVSGWFRAGLAIGSDPESPHYWGPDANYHQHHVEIGVIAIALQIAPDQLWEPLSQVEKDRVAHWLGTARGNGIVNNNHYFMGIHILEFLIKQGYGRPTDRVVIDTFLDRLELMHRGGGWFEDGINQAYDHYNAYAFHFYGLWWVKLHGKDQPERAARWIEWGRLFVRDYVHFFAASGEHPSFGRSITYRFNGINVFGLVMATGTTELAPGMLQRLCTRNLDFFMNRPITQEQGCLSLGWIEPFHDLIETYSCGGSPYWAAKGLSPLLLPPGHAFWNEPETPLPSEEGDHTRVVPPAGLTVRSIDGEVEILNAGSQISNVNLRYGAWKWSKTAYRTGVDFTIARPAQTNWSPDSALTMRLPDGRVFGRHSTVAIEMDEDHVRYVWNLGFKHDQINCSVDSAVWWKAGWKLEVHEFECRQPAILAIGGYALGSEDAASFRKTEQANHLAVWSGENGSVIQSLTGFTGEEWDERIDESIPRCHLSSPYHSTPIFTTDQLGRAAGEIGFLATLTWTGSDRAQAEPWTITSATKENWQMTHPHFGDWTIQHPLLAVLN